MVSRNFELLSQNFELLSRNFELLSRNFKIKKKLPGPNTLLYSSQVCVPPVLKTIQSLGLSSKLKSICIKLMTELWTLQDRCFPHLLKLITDDTEKQGTRVVDDVTSAKAVAIRQVCKLR